MDSTTRQTPQLDTLLRERVYEYLKRSLAAGELSPGSFLNLSSLQEGLGLSRTPLRDALLRLEAEGFVTIHSRRGVVVTALDPPTIRNIYQIIGALEGSAAEEASTLAAESTWTDMENLNREMKKALKRDSFDEYYARNLEFHDSFVSLSKNDELKDTIHILKERLYDFPRRKAYLREWETASVREHDEIIRLFRRGDFTGASAYLRNRHWSFALQEHYVNQYYFSSQEG
jgi:DNA-binding GntR family transcriptional regulator